MPTTTPTILDQISAEKTKISERLARLDTDRAAVAIRLTDLETAERVLTRVNKTPPARRTTSATTAEAKAPTASRGRGRVQLVQRDVDAFDKGARLGPDQVSADPPHLTPELRFVARSVSRA